MMRSRGVLMLLVAMVAGLLAVLFASQWMQMQAGNGRGKVVVAATDIPLGAVLSPDMLTLANWPSDARPDGAFDTLDALRNRVMTVSLQKGEPVLARRLAVEGSKGGLSSLVAPGKRAMTVRVNDVVGVAGFALPGTYVDVLVNTQADATAGHSGQSVSKIVLERILVLAVAQDVDRDATKPQVANAVTLEVTPEQAELLDLARSVGTLSLVLRNQTERDAADTQGVTKEALLGMRAKAQVAPVAVPMPTVSVPSAAPAAAPRRQAVAAAEVRTCVEVVRAGARSSECF